MRPKKGETPHGLDDQHLQNPKNNIKPNNQPNKQEANPLKYPWPPWNNQEIQSTATQKSTWQIDSHPAGNTQPTSRIGIFPEFAHTHIYI